MRKALSIRLAFFSLIGLCSGLTGFAQDDGSEPSDMMSMYFEEAELPEWDNALIYTNSWEEIIDNKVFLCGALIVRDIDTRWGVFSHSEDGLEDLWLSRAPLGENIYWPPAPGAYVRNEMRSLQFFELEYGENFRRCTPVETLEGRWRMEFDYSPLAVRVDPDRFVQPDVPGDVNLLPADRTIRSISYCDWIDGELSCKPREAE